MSATTVYPDQLMLPGQAAAPGGPVEMMVMYLMHHAFRRDLRRMSEAVPLTPLDDHDTWVALADRWERFGTILHHHHSGEDAGIWPFLLERADPDEAVHLHAMEAEHEKIDPLLQSCGSLFAQLATPGDRGGRAATVTRSDLRAGLSVRLSEARELLSNHLRHEESEAMVILQRHMTPEDWEQIEKEHFGPQTGRTPLTYMVPWIAEEIAPDKLQEVFATTGLPMKILWVLTRRRFRRTERRAFRYLPV